VIHQHYPSPFHSGFPLIWFASPTYDPPHSFTVAPTPFVSTLFNMFLPVDSSIPFGGVIRENTEVWRRSSLLVDAVTCETNTPRGSPVLSAYFQVALETRKVTAQVMPASGPLPLTEKLPIELLERVFLFTSARDILRLSSVRNIAEIFSNPLSVRISTGQPRLAWYCAELSLDSI